MRKPRKNDYDTASPAGGHSRRGGPRCPALRRRRTNQPRHLRLHRSVQPHRHRPVAAGRTCRTGLVGAGSLLWPGGLHRRNHHVADGTRSMARPPSGGGRRGSRRLRAGRAHLRPAGSLPGTGHPGTECGDGRAGPQRTGSDGRAHRTDGDPPSFDWRTRDRRGSSLLLSHLVLRPRCALAGPQSGVFTSRTRAGRRPQ